MSKAFIDTNILIYSLDQADPEKQVKARTLLKSLQSTGSGVISTQVLQEFYVTATKKLKLNPDLAKRITRTFINFETVTVDSPIIEQAIDLNITEKISFWDAAIIATAASAHCRTVWTEDMNHSQIVKGIIIKNPFIP